MTMDTHIKAVSIRNKMATLKEFEARVNDRKIHHSHIVIIDRDNTKNVSIPNSVFEATIQAALELAKDQYLELEREFNSL